jgi:hypothetical protein
MKDSARKPEPKPPRVLPIEIFFFVRHVAARCSGKRSAMRVVDICDSIGSWARKPRSPASKKVSAIRACEKAGIGASGFKRRRRGSNVWLA